MAVKVHIQYSAKLLALPRNFWSPMFRGCPSLFRGINDFPKYDARFSVWNTQSDWPLCISREYLWAANTLPPRNPGSPPPSITGNKNIGTVLFGFRSILTRTLRSVNPAAHAFMAKFKVRCDAISPGGQRLRYPVKKPAQGNGVDSMEGHADLERARRFAALWAHPILVELLTAFPDDYRENKIPSHRELRQNSIRAREFNIEQGAAFPGPGRRLLPSTCQRVQIKSSNTPPTRHFSRFRFLASSASSSTASALFDAHRYARHIPLDLEAFLSSFPVTGGARSALVWVLDSWWEWHGLRAHILCTTAFWLATMRATNSFPSNWRVVAAAFRGAPHAMNRSRNSAGLTSANPAPRATSQSFPTMKNIKWQFPDPVESFWALQIHPDCLVFQTGVAGLGKPSQCEVGKCTGAGENMCSGVFSVSRRLRPVSSLLYSALFSRRCFVAFLWWSICVPFVPPFIVVWVEPFGVEMWVEMRLVGYTAHTA
ncbi:hypothetical protein C8R45DRAFT_1081163 [Mycena sanguinolenta]|nr:hypothetical protein C8R45DRAFT_1081163 [Mycena sanguinolenta]